MKMGLCNCTGWKGEGVIVGWEWGGKSPSNTYFLKNNANNYFFQVFSYTADKEIRTDDLCLDVSRLNGPVIMLKCHHMRGNQLWEYDAEVFIQTQKETKRTVTNHVQLLSPGSQDEQAKPVTWPRIKPLRSCVAAFSLAKKSFGHGWAWCFL